MQRSISCMMNDDIHLQAAKLRSRIEITLMELMSASKISTQSDSNRHKVENSLTNQDSYDYTTPEMAKIINQLSTNSIENDILKKENGMLYIYLGLL